MLLAFIVALQFLTIVRVRESLPFDDETLGRSGAFFPVIGLLIGLVVWGFDQGLSAIVPPALRNIFLVIVLVVISRGLHLDGLADSADGLLGSGDRQRSLAIMKDSRIGAFGALALIGVLLAKLRALDLLTDGHRTPALLLSPMFGRWACVVMAYLAPPAREEGLGAMFVRGTQFRTLLIVHLLLLVAGFLFAGLWTALLFLFLGGLTVGFTRYCTRRLGGVTGDTLGAVGELVETAAFCLFAVLDYGGSPH
ncbi:MAG TPA: adenosylcobinamide-GDP ribazoletransferase [Methylomirabilota bacterium]|nr:adenosylcobinamide-GDP ribazoletransferase [Methylomirabilota bacterium]